MTASVVRTAQPREEEDIMQVCRELHEENGLFDMDETMVRAMLRRAFDRRGGIIGVIGGPGAIEAVIFLIISNFWYSQQPHLEELFSYCRPQYRRSGHAKSLVEFAKRCSDELYMPLVIGIVSNIRTEAKVRLYRRQLSEPAGAFFVYNSPAAAKELQHGQ